MEQMNRGIRVCGLSTGMLAIFFFLRQTKLAAGRIGLCRSATRAPSRPWIADASAPGAAARQRQEMTSEGCLSKPRSKAINSFLTILSGWVGSGLRDELFVWVQDILTARLEPL